MSDPRNPSIRAHAHRLERLVFRAEGGGLPRWLATSARDLRKRYREVQSTAEFDSAIEGIQRARDKPFELFVVGEGNFGKSTLINGLFGAELSRVHFLPETRAFLRFIPRKKQSGKTRLFIRAGDDHRWLVARAGRARDSDLFGAREYLVSDEVAGELLAEEAKRCRKQRGYVPAIIELERDVAIGPQARLPVNVRVVDTQGLNQLFPDELQKLSDTLDQRTSEQRFRAWMRTTTRGHHLDWQLRRCDAILWVAHARKSSSAITRTALVHFSRYGKPTVLAVTNIDRVDGGDEGRARVMAKVQAEYGRFVRSIHPVNAKAAMKHALGGDAPAEDTGFGSLQLDVERLVADDAGVTRGLAAYNSLVVTELQLRTALRNLRTDMRAALKQEKRFRKEIATWHQAALPRVRRVASSAAATADSSLVNAIDRITLSDTAQSAKDKLKSDRIGQALRSELNAEVERAHAELERICAGFERKPFTLPTFDAEGDRAANAVSVRFFAQLQPPPTREFRLILDVQPDYFQVVGLWVKENVFGLFSANARAEAINERKRKTKALHDRVTASARPQFRAFREEVLSASTARIDAQGGEAQAAVTRAIEELEQVERRPLAESIKKIGAALRMTTMKPELLLQVETVLYKERHTLTAFARSLFAGGSPVGAEPPPPKPVDDILAAYLADN